MSKASNTVWFNGIAFLATGMIGDLMASDRDLCGVKKKLNSLEKHLRSGWEAAQIAGLDLHEAYPDVYQHNLDIRDAYADLLDRYEGYKGFRNVKENDLYALLHAIKSLRQDALNQILAKGSDIALAS